MERSVDSHHELLIRTKDEIKILSGLPDMDRTETSFVGFQCLYSPSGGRLSYLGQDGVHVLNSSSLAEELYIPSPEVQFLTFSEDEECLIAWDKSLSSLLVWHISSGTQSLAFPLKKFPKENTIQFGRSHWYIQLAHELHVFNLVSQPALLNTPKVTSFSVNRFNDHIVVFTVGHPAQVTYIINSDTVHTTFVEKEAVSEAQIKWSFDGLHALAWCQTDVDSTGRSYYGEHVVYKIDPLQPGVLVPTTDGPVYDVQWSPVATEFIEVSGFMPSTVTLHTLEEKIEITKNHRNHIRWNAFGDLVLVGGFGNLNGDIDIIERSSLKTVGYCRADVTVACEWAPCGRVFISATMCPRLRVDNGFRIYSYNGDLLMNVPALNELWFVQWRNRVCEASPLKLAGYSKVKPERKVYRPPGSTSDFAEKFRSRNIEIQSARVLNRSGLEVNNSSTAQKKKKRKRKKKKKSQEIHSER